jgi:MFS family permease
MNRSELDPSQTPGNRAAEPVVPARLASAGPLARAMLRPILRLRWWIGGLLLASIIINYIDRQTLSALAPFLKQDQRWANEDYALIVIAFRIAYTIGQTVFGRALDRIGRRLGHWKGD